MSFDLKCARATSTRRESVGDVGALSGVRNHRQRGGIEEPTKIEFLCVRDVESARLFKLLAETSDIFSCSRAR